MIDNVSGYWQEMHDYNNYSMLMLVNVTLISLQNRYDYAILIFSVTYSSTFFYQINKQEIEMLDNKISRLLRM